MSDLRERFERIATGDLERELSPGSQGYESRKRFALQRLQEGLELAAHFSQEYRDRKLVILDVGAGNSGVSAGLSESGNLVVGVDIVPNHAVIELRRSGVEISQVVARAEALPFRDETVDIVLCLETIEHLTRLREAGSEMMRALVGDGEVMITTPARLRFLWKGDPHFDVRGLALLPDALQRKVIRDWLRIVEDYDVTHLFWTAWGIMSNFPGRLRTDVLVAIPWPGRPRNLKEILWKLLRHFLWDRIVIYKRPVD